MFENGIDYIERAVESYHKNDTKVTCLFLWSGILLLLKQRLYDINPAMILDKVEMERNGKGELVLPELDKNGNFKTVDFEGIKQRFKKLKCKYDLIEKYGKCFNDLRKLRNRIEHFDFEVKDDDILKVFHSLMPFINDFIEVELGKKPHDVFHDYLRFLKIEDFYKARLETMKKYIEKEEPSWHDIADGEIPLDKCECPDCPEGIIISKGEVFYCEACGYKEKLHVCIRCEGRFPDHEWSSTNEEISICDNCWDAILDKN